MSLIDLYGSYKSAKSAENEMIDRSLVIDVIPLSRALLEYRRKHNFFELGDAVIFPAISNAVVVWDGCLTMFLSQGLVRHATDKEIEQGFRDD